MLRLRFILAALIAMVTMAAAVLAQRPPGWLGISFRGQTPVIIDDVFPGGPAERAGVLPGDSLLQISGRPATSVSVDSVLSRLAAGASVALEVQRHGVTTVISVTAARRPSLGRATTGLVVDVDSVRMLASAYLDGARRSLRVIAPAGFSAELSDSGLMISGRGRGAPVRINVDSVVARGRSLPTGASYVDTTGHRSLRVLRETTERIAGLVVATLGSSAAVPTPKGVVVVSIDAESPLAAFGLRPLDLILKVDDQATPDASALNRAVANPRQIATITVARNRETVVLRK